MSAGIAFPDDITLSEAKARLRELIDEGARCPCCTQTARVYLRTIHASMASGLVKLYKRGGGFHEIRGFMTHNELADFAKLAYWDLIAEDGETREDGSTRTGWWRITKQGEQFVRGEIALPKHARVYDGRLLGLRGDGVMITDCLGRKFNYAELMGAEEALKTEETRHTVSPEPVSDGPVGAGPAWEGHQRPEESPPSPSDTTLFDLQPGFDEFDEIVPPRHALDDEN